MWKQWLFVGACVFLPILWGVAVNWLFNFWQDHTRQHDDEEPIFPEYQI